MNIALERRARRRKRVIDDLRAHVPGTWRYEWPSRWCHESGMVVQSFACCSISDVGYESYFSQMRRSDTGAVVHPGLGLGLEPPYTNGDRSVQRITKHSQTSDACYEQAMGKMLRMDKGDVYEAVREFGENRAIIDNGALVFVTRRDDGLWEFGEPARPGPELDTLNALVKERLGTTVTVTDPDGDVTTFKDE